MLGTILKLIRIANDMSTKNAAETTGISSTYISEVESGNKSPSISPLNSIANTYNIPASKILLFEETAVEHQLNYQQILKLILEYYIYEQSNEESIQKNNYSKKQSFKMIVFIYLLLP